MKYINQLNAYWNWARLNPLPSKAGYLYFALLDCANAACWKREINVPNSTLQAMAGLDKNGLVRYRNQLIQNGLIEYKPGNRGSNGTYKIIPFRGNQYDTEIDTKNDTQTQPKTILKRNQKGESTLLFNKDKDKDIDISPPISPPGGKSPAKKQEPEPDYFAELPEDLRKKADDWLAYKRGRRFTYQPSGKRALASQMSKYAGQYGASAVCDAIDQAIASGYQGIVWDAIGRTKGSKPHGRQTRAHNHHQRTYTEAELAKIGVDLLEGG